MVKAMTLRIRFCQVVLVFLASEVLGNQFCPSSVSIAPHHARLHEIQEQNAKIQKLTRTVTELQSTLSQINQLVSQQGSEIDGLVRINTNQNNTICQTFSSVTASTSPSPSPSASVPSPLVAFGENSNGELGDGTTNFATAAVNVILPEVFRSTQKSNANIVFSAGKMNSAASDGQSLYLWGKTYLGDGSDLRTYHIPTHSEINPDTNTATVKVQSLCAGAISTIFASGNGEVFVIGANFLGGLGVGDRLPQLDAVKLNNRDDTTSTTTDPFGGQSINQVFCGLYFSSFLTQNNAGLWMTGGGQSGELGTGTSSSSSVPIETNLWFTSTSGDSKIDMGSSIVQLATGFSFSLALTSTGQVFAWGFNGFGQLGDNTYVNRNLPQLVDFDHVNNNNNGDTTVSTVISAIACGGFHSLAKNIDGQIFSWGYNRFGQLCDGESDTTTSSSRLQPIAIPNMDLFGGSVRMMDGGKHVSLFVNENGSLFGCGNTKYLGIGMDTEEVQNYPLQLNQGLLNGKIVKDISVGFGHSLVYIG
eukprot:c5360_g1_i1.p1 GENE.c5360_g1_i1~~c5360_g1_i1.p1  ORF type:complete len:532 (+),score=114.40 c5360_g1_i1:69-1664(+)